MKNEQSTVEALTEVPGLENFWDEPHVKKDLEEEEEEAKAPVVPSEEEEEETHKVTSKEPQEEPTASPEDNGYAQQLYENFKELGIIKNMEFKEGEEITQDALLELMEADREALVQERVEHELNEFVGNIGEDEKLALSFMKKGGKIKDFANLYSGAPVKLNGDIANEAYQDEIIRYYEKNYNGTPDEDITEILEAFTTSGKKELRAKTYLQNLNKKVAEEKAVLLRKQEVAVEQKKQIKQQDMTAVKSSINELKIKDKVALTNFLLQEDVELENGRKISKFQYELGQVISDPKKRVILAQFLQKGVTVTPEKPNEKPTNKFNVNLKSPTLTPKRGNEWENFNL